jgi:hypothetical protein
MAHGGDSTPFPPVPNESLGGKPQPMPTSSTRQRTSITDITVKLPDALSKDPTMIRPNDTEPEYRFAVPDLNASSPLRFTFDNRSLGICHHPLYFEDVCAERYGDSGGLFEAPIAAAHFYGTIVVLPYKMVQVRPRECVGSWETY